MTAWTYNQRTGALCDPSGACVAVGYAGAEPYGVNRPIAQSIENVGPLPRGTYTIGEPRDDDTMGPFCLPLEPAETNEMFGRHSFYVHGDSIDAPGTASTGCVIMPRDVRDRLAASEVRELVVEV